jgi:hypothetical protein
MGYLSSFFVIASSLRPGGAYDPASGSESLQLRERELTPTERMDWESLLPFVGS